MAADTINTEDIVLSEQLLDYFTKFEVVARCKVDGETLRAATSVELAGYLPDGKWYSLSPADAESAKEGARMAVRRGVQVAIAKHLSRT